MTKFEVLSFGIPSLLAVLALGIAWGEYRGYRKYQEHFQHVVKLLSERLELGDKVLTALNKGERVSVITGENQSITNFWIKDAKKLRREDWEALEETTRQLRGRRATKVDKPG